MSNTFLQTLKTRPILADGGMGTLLYSRGASPEGSFEQLNITRSELIQQVHIEYINAGAELIETNSFSANRLKLAHFGLEGEVWKFNVWAAKIARAAREITGQPIFVAGSVGPSGKLLAPFGDVSADEISRTFQEQMEALLAGGVDLFMIETMSSIDELALAVRAARAVSQLPVVAQLSFSTEGSTLVGNTPEDVVRVLQELGDEAPDVIGINCGAGPGPVFDSLIRMSSALRNSSYPEDKLMFSCLPNAGQPSLSGGRYVFMSRPDYCASYVEPFLRAGVRLVGGCCGTTPEHIRKMRSRLDKYIQSSKQSASATLLQLPALQSNKGLTVNIKPPDQDPLAEPLVPGFDRAEKHDHPEKHDEPATTRTLRERLNALKAQKNPDDFFISVEIDPPKGAVYRKILQAAQLVKAAGADSINVGDSPMARVRMSSLATCKLVSTEAGIDTIIHFTTRDRNLMGIQADLLGCQALGIRNVLALTGDPPSLGNYAHATAVYDVDSIGLIKIINQLNNGLDISGNSIGSPTSLSIGCALNLTEETRAEERGRLRKKIEKGAHFIMTQPIYQLTDLLDFLQDFGECTLPILVGIMPLHSFKHAEYLHNEVPGINIPQSIRDALQKAGDEGQRVGLELAETLLEETRSICQGAYLVPSFGRFEDTAELISRVKAKTRTHA